MRCRPRSRAFSASSWWCRRRTASSTRWCWRRRELAGVDEIYRIGGAQAIAALAYGTETHRARRQDRRPRQRLRRRRQAPGVRQGRHRHDRRSVRGAGHRRQRQRSGLDRRRSAGPGRARHGRQVDPDDRRCGLRRRGRRRRRGQLATLPRAEIARASWRRFRRHHPGRDASTRRPRSPTASRPSISRSPPTDADALAATIRNAGAIFLGRYTPEVIGDYVAGSNHVLPTARSARFSSGLGVLDFMKRTSHPEARCRQPRGARPRRHDAGPGRGARGPSPLRRHPARTCRD